MPIYFDIFVCNLIQIFFQTTGENLRPMKTLDASFLSKESISTKRVTFYIYSDIVLVDKIDFCLADNYEQH